MGVLEELLPAQNKCYDLGLKLKLPQYLLDSIQLQYSSPQDRLLHIITYFLNQVEPRPTWKVIVDALRSPVVNLPSLSLKLEFKYCDVRLTPVQSTQG